MVPQGTQHQALPVALDDSRCYCNFLTKFGGTESKKGGSFLVHLLLMRRGLLHKLFVPKNSFIFLLSIPPKMG